MKKKLEHSHKIHRLQLGTQGADKGIMTYFHDYGTDLTADFPIQFFYIEGPEEDVIVDCGSPAEMNNQFSADAVDIRTLDEALAIVGKNPEDIDIIIATHLMYDHMGNAQKFPNARVYVQETELKFVYNGLNPIIGGFYSTHFLRDVKFIPIQGEREIVPGVRVWPSPGHTPGTQSVAVETEEGLAVMTGFCCIEENFSAEECPESKRDAWNNMIPIGIHINAMEAWESQLRVKVEADIIIPQHGRKIPAIVG